MWFVAKSHRDEKLSNIYPWMWYKSKITEHEHNLGIQNCLISCHSRSHNCSLTEVKPPKNSSEANLQLNHSVRQPATRDNCRIMSTTKRLWGAILLMLKVRGSVLGWILAHSLCLPLPNLNPLELFFFTELDHFFTSPFLRITVSLVLTFTHENRAIRALTDSCGPVYQQSKIQNTTTMV